MTENSLDLLISRFARAAEHHHEAIEAFDVSTANRQAAILTGLFASIRKHGEIGEKRLRSLLQHPSPPVAGMAAVYLLTSTSQLALPVLERLATMPGLLGFRARAALDRWQNGEWDEPG